MQEIHSIKKNSACPPEKSCCPDSDPIPLTGLPMAQAEPEDAPCCGAPPGPPSSPFERPGYSLCHFVDSFVDTANEPVPKIQVKLGYADYLGTIKARLGISRDQYKVSPGLYSIGMANPDSPVLVTANYKLSFDHLRQELAGVDAWILVLDTRGVNVWCAAAKKTFSTDEIVRQVRRVKLENIVNHREIILPQLGAPGVSAHQVKKQCGFTVVWGPIKSLDIGQFLQNGQKIEPEMRQLTFDIIERIVLVPVEISLIVKPSIWILLAVFVFSGIGPDIFSLSAAVTRGADLALAYFLGLLAGAVAVPALLPWLPGRSFYLKGIATGVAFGMVSVGVIGSMTGYEACAMVLMSVAVSSYAAMNFTGATPYTSPSGVEKEMRYGIPIQTVAILVTLVLWVGAPFWR